MVARWQSAGLLKNQTWYNNNANRRLVARVSHNERPITAFTDIDTLVYDWSPDSQSTTRNASSQPGGNSRIVGKFPSPPHLMRREQRRKLLPKPEYSLWQPHYSSNGRWIVFQAVSNEETAARSTLYVMPSEGGTWRKITDGSVWDDKPRWSVDSKTIYYVSGRGAFFNLWGIHFDDSTGEAVGKPFRVSDFDKPSFTIPRWIPVVALSVTQNRLLVTMQESSGNVWVLGDVDH